MGKRIMKFRKIAILAAVIFSLGIALAVFAEDNKSASAEFEQKRKELWTEFQKVRFEKFGKFKKINIYAENDSLTSICFICDKGLFFYSHKNSNMKGISHIEAVVSAKLVIYDTINRITYVRDKKSSLGFFELWHDESKELSIGSD